MTDCTGLALHRAGMCADVRSLWQSCQRDAKIRAYIAHRIRDITNALAGYLTGEGLEILTGVAVEIMRRERGRVVVTAKIHGERREFIAAQILVTTGRTPNTRNMGLEHAGVLLDDHGHKATLVNPGSTATKKPCCP